MVSVNTDQPTKKTSKGKQKIEIKKIDMKASRQVTFSKRSKGLFRKCSELSKFGSQYAVVTFSVAGKPVVHGYPSPESVIHRFLNDSEASKTDEGTWCSSGKGCHSYWWENPIDNLGLEDLEKYKIALEGLRKQVLSRVDQINCSNDIETEDLGCIVIASDDVYVPDVSQKIVEGSNETETDDLGCIDAIDDVYLPDFSQEITEIMNFEKPKKFQITHECSNDTEFVNLGYIDASYDAQVSKVSQEKTDEFDFGWMEKSLGGQVSDYFEWMDHTVPEIYPELLPVDDGPRSSFDMTGCW